MGFYSNSGVTAKEIITAGFIAVLIFFSISILVILCMHKSQIRTSTDLNSMKVLTNVEVLKCDVEAYNNAPKYYLYVLINEARMSKILVNQDTYGRVDKGDVVNLIVNNDKGTVTDEYKLILPKISRAPSQQLNYDYTNCVIKSVDVTEEPYLLAVTKLNSDIGNVSVVVDDANIIDILIPGAVVDMSTELRGDEKLHLISIEYKYYMPIQ